MLLFEPADWAARGQLQAAQRPHHVRGVEPRRLERVCRLGSRRRRKSVGSVGGVVRRERQGGGPERPAPTTAVPAPGPVGDQGDPLAPAATRRDDLHGSVRIQCVQDNICVESLRSHEECNEHISV